MNTPGLASLSIALVIAANAAGAEVNQPAITAAYNQLRPHAILSDAERDSLARRGWIAVYLPLGGDERGLLSELKQVDATAACTFINDRDIGGGALKNKAAIILPDLGDYAPLPARDEAIKAFITDGGGAYAVGSAITYLHSMGLFEAELVTFRARGNVVAFLEGYRAFDTGVIPPVLGDAGPLLRQYCTERLLTPFTAFSLTSYMNKGPLFRLPENSPLSVIGYMGINQVVGSSVATIPGMAAGPVGRGRIVLLSGGEAGVTSKDNPVDAQPLKIAGAEPTVEEVDALVGPIVRKQLLLYVAGDPSAALLRKEP